MSRTFRFADFEFDARTGDLRRSQQPVELEPLARRVLAYLLVHRSRVVSREELIQEVWEGRRVVAEAVTRTIGLLRQALHDDRQRQAIIKTWPRRGYQFVAPLRTSRSETGMQSSIPFVGRERILEQLEAALEASAQGRGRIVVLSGDPGIGKTRLIEELGDRALARGGRLLWGWCYEPAGEPPYWPWVSILRAALASHEPERLQAWLGANDAVHLGRMVSEFGELKPESGEPTGGSPEEQRFRLFDAVVRFLARTAVTTPHVLVLEDLHWAESATLGLLEFLAQEIADSKLLVLGSFRDTEVSSGEPLMRTLAELSRHSAVQRIRLEGFDREETRRLMVAMRGVEPPAPLVDDLIERTEGNPFFLKEMLMALGEAEVGRGSVEAPAGLPRQIEEALGSQLARLSPECRELLAVAALIGRGFDLPVLAQVWGGPEHQLPSLLEEGLRASIVHESGTVPGRFAFAHALTQEVALARLSAARRPRIHRRIAQALEGLPRPDAERRLPELAHHYCQAAVEKDHLHKAVDFSVRAAERAYRSAAWEEVIARTAQPLELLEGRSGVDEFSASELELLLWRSRALYAARGYTNPDLMRSLERASDLCEALGKEKERIRTLLIKGACHMVRAEFGDCERECARALVLARAARDSDGGFAAHSYLAIIYTCLGSFDEAQRQLEQTRSLYDEEGLQSLRVELGQDQEVTRRSTWAMVALYRGFADAAFEHARVAVEQGRRSKDAYSQAFALWFSCNLRMLASHGIEEARELADRCLALCRKRRIPFFAALALFYGGAATVELGEQEGLEHMERGVAELMALGASSYLATWVCLIRGRALYRVGRKAEALGVVDAGLQIASQTQERVVEAELHRLKGDLLRETSGIAAALSCYERAVETARRQGGRWFELRAATRLAWVQLEQGEGVAAGRLVEELCAGFTEGFETSTWQEAKALLDRLAQSVSP